MITIQQISKDRTNARGIDALKYSLLTTLLGDLELEAKRVGDPDLDATPIIQKFIKNTEMILGVCPDNLKAVQERNILLAYLPKQLGKDDFKVILERLGSNTALSYFMTHLKENFKGQYDGKLASETYKELANG